jgi:signal-transduction protein with cAMP-binding, CBS, and nucleotidyltransferase domain
MNIVVQEYYEKSVTDLIDQNFIILDESMSINVAAKVMEINSKSSILVKESKSSSIKGIVTEKDILYRGLTKNKSTFKVHLGSIMSSPLITIDKSTSCEDAINIMVKNGIQQLPVLDKGIVVGMIKLNSLATSILDRNVELTGQELTNHLVSFVKCPYCESTFKDKVELSIHNDRIHIGSGLLEGDSRRW